MTSSSDREAPITIGDLTRAVRQVEEERQWEVFHDPKNLAMALVSEAGELAALLRWIPNDEADAFLEKKGQRSRLRDEIGDVGICLLLLCDRAGISFEGAVLEKLAKIGAKYPVELSTGRADPPRTSMAEHGEAGRAGVTSDPRWSVYPDTILEFENGSEALTVDLRRPLSEWDREALSAWQLPTPFGVITAANPIGRELSHAANQSRNEALRALLESLGVRHLASEGLSPDGSRREAGFAIHASREMLHRLANEFEQSAYFWFDGHAFWLVDATDDSHELRLPPEEQ
jgi:NTP pyrophosphatase (non-canonical NTP hydrolase)